MNTPSFAVAAVFALMLVAPPAAHAYRLPTDVAPTFESIRLRVDADSANYSGSVHMDLTVRHATATIQLYAQGQTLDEVKLVQKGRAIPVRQATGERGLLTLTADPPLAAGPASLDIRFTNALGTQAVGLYRVVKDGLGYTFTQFEADEARRAFPCWDEPGFKFPYQITLEVPERHEALTNTPIQSQTSQDGWKTIAFAATPPLPSYLLAIATGPLEFTPIPGCSVPARVVCVKGQSRLTGLAVQETPRILAALEDYFGQPYPFAKLDLIAVPEFWAGAMENPGAITYADNVLLLDPAATSTAQHKGQVRITAHELAHMWFGDLVTLAWWDDMWLNESFADWMGDKITDRLMPDLHHRWSSLEASQDIMASDARPSTEPIRLQAENGDDAMRTVGLAYNKGKAVLAMFEQWMGPETFRSGIRGYLKEHAWKNAEAGDLWAALDRVSGRQVAAAMRGYIEQRGHPLVTVEPLAGGSVRVTQKRFLNYGVQADSLQWRIPMVLRYSDGGPSRTMQVMLDTGSRTVKLDGVSSLAWVMPNAGAMGYYRWSVPHDMLLALSKDAAHLMDPAERIGFLGNLGALLDAGEVHGDAYLEALGAMADEPEPVVALQVISNLEKVKSAFVPDEMRDAFAGYVRRTLRPMAGRFGLEKRAGEPDEVSLLRPQLLAWLGREGRDPAVLEQAGRIAERYMADPPLVDPGLAGVALQLRALGGDLGLFERYRVGFESAGSPAARRGYLSALGCFEDPAVQDTALRYSLEGPLRPNEFSAISRTVQFSGERGAERAFGWLRANYDAVGKRLPESSRSRLASYCAGCSARRLAEGKEFFSDPARVMPATGRQLDRITEQVNDCLALRAREGVAVAAYLKRP